MSAKNVDKSRFHRERKQKIARRMRTRELLNRTPTQSRSGDSSAASRPRTVSA
jgi:hypothetical protein